MAHRPTDCPADVLNSPESLDGAIDAWPIASDGSQTAVEGLLGVMTDRVEGEVGLGR